MDSIIEVARAALRGDAVERMSAWTGESTLAVQQCVDAAAPLAIVGLARQASTEGRAQGLVEAIEDETYPSIEPGDLGLTLESSAATDRLARSSEGVLQRIFGSRREGVIDALAAHARVSRASASKLLGLVSALVAGIVRHEARIHTLDARSLSRYLGEKERTAMSLLPLALVGQLGTVPTAVVDAASRGAERHAAPTRGPESTAPHTTSAPPPSTWKWLPWLAAAAAVIALLSFVFNKKPQRFDALSRPAPSEAARPAEPTAPPVMAAPPLAILSIATGTDALAHYLAGAEPTPRRFLVEGIEFEVGSSKIASNRTLDDVGAMLIAQPTAKIRVEAHTDSVGSPSTNDTLTQAQAEAVKSYLVRRGVAADHIDTAGLGARQPVASNDTPEGRDRNRRIELIVIQR